MLNPPAPFSKGGKRGTFPKGEKIVPSNELVDFLSPRLSRSGIKKAFYEFINIQSFLYQANIYPKIILKSRKKYPQMPLSVFL